MKLENAKILSVKVRPNFRYGTTALGILVEDSVHGKVWFQTTAKWAYEKVCAKGSLLSGIVEVRDTKDDYRGRITFVKAPRNAIITATKETENPKGVSGPDYSTPYEMWP